jgi:hypothetical protein
MRISPIVNSFSSGELSPRLMGRTDSDKYTSGAEVMENFIPLPHGGALRRGGTRHIAEVKTSTQEQRLIPFEYSIDQTYDLEIGNEYIRFYTESAGVYGQVQSGGSAYEITAPWLESEVDDIQFAQNADIMWLVHPNHPPQRIVRVSHTSWTLTAESFDFTPLNEVNYDDTQTLAFSVLSTANQNLTASWSLFESSMVGQDMLVDVLHGEPTGEVIHVKVVSITSATVAVVSIESDEAVPSLTATAFWQAPAYTSTNGYPAALVFYEQRLWYAGTTAKPQSMWGSKTGVYNNFETGVNADQALFYTIASDRVNQIKWLAATTVMMAGTTGGEFRISGGGESAITPTNVDVRRQTSHGSRRGRPVYVGNAVFFIQRSNTKVRNLSYKWESDAFASDDMTFLAEHVTGTGINHIAFSQIPDNLLLGIRDDGQLLSMVYEPSQDIVGWSRHVTDGKYIDVSITSRAGNDRWTFIVERTIDGVTKRYIEIYEEDHFLDCHARYEGTATTSITGLDFLEGKTVSILADGAVHPQKVVSSGAITLNYAAEDVIVGLEYVSKLTPTRYGANVGDGTSMGRQKRWSEIFVQLSNSAVPKINGVRPPVRGVDTTYGTAEPLTSEDVNVRNLGYNRDGTVEIEHELPLPCHIVAIFGTLGVGT